MGCHLRSQGPPGGARGDTPLVKARVTALWPGAGGLAVSVGDGGPQKGRAGQHLPRQTQVGIMMVRPAGLSTGQGADSPAAPRAREEVATGKGSLGAESEQARSSADTLALTSDVNGFMMGGDGGREGRKGLV